jgi:hypothetical protein
MKCFAGKSILALATIQQAVVFFADIAWRTDQENGICFSQ